MGEEQRLRVDINCQRKWITVPVTVVLELVDDFDSTRDLALNPAPDELFPHREAKLAAAVHVLR